MKPFPARLLLTAAAALALAGSAEAESPPAGASSGAPTPESPARVGERTKAWLALQREEKPGRNAHGLPRAARSRALERYLESFSHPIPDLFDLEELEADPR